MSSATSRGDGVTLTARLLVLFLTTLALVLAGFSTSLYLLARTYLRQQAEERLEAALSTLVAAVDVGPDGVEWEPAERHLSIGPTSLGDPVIWRVSDDRGRVVDRSAQEGADELLAEAARAMRPGEGPLEHTDGQGARWRCGLRWIQPAGPPAPRSGPARPAQADEVKKHAALAIAAGVSLEPLRASLRRLAGVLAGLSLGIWLLALVAGRLVCRRALRPVTRMALAAGVMDTNDLEERLPVPATGDELEDLSRAFNNLLDRVQESFRRQQCFTAEASHQLRTPLAAMLGQVEVALRRERPAEEYRRALTAVQRQAGHLTRIVEALLFLARADREARLPDRELVHVGGWLPGHLPTWSEHPRAGDIRLECDGLASGPVAAQPVLLGELVNILLDNACKFSDQGTPIAVRLRHEPHQVCLQVQDEGMGIAPADLAHVFTPFFRSSEARRLGVEGTGLGLAIARRLAEAFGGELTATSELGKGSCFTLRLPVSEDAEARS
jgi:signal transduction histidine kinase